MSEWDIGQAGGTVGNSRRSLTDALMLRFGGDGGSGRESVEKTASPQERKGTAFSDILADRSSSVQKSPRVRGAENRAVDTKHQDGGHAAGLRKAKDMTARTFSRSAAATAEQEPGQAVKVKAFQPTVATERQEPLDAEMPAEALMAEATEPMEEPAPEAYAGMLAELMSALQAAIENLQSPEVDEQDYQPDNRPIQETGSPLQQTETTPDASMEEQLRGLLGRLSMETAESVVTSIAKAPEAFLQKLRALLQTVGLEQKDLQTISSMENMDGDASLQAKLVALAEGVRASIAQTAVNVDTESLPVPETGSEEILMPVNPAESEGGDMDQSSSDGKDKNARHTPTAFAAAGQTPEGGRAVAAVAQGTGVHVAAMEGGRTFGQLVAQVAQSKADDLPQMPATPQTTREVASQVMTRLQTMSGDEKHEMELQLKPESLGKIQLRIVEERGQVLAKFTAESETVRAILESNMQLLKDALEKNGMTVQELSVSVGQRQQEQQAPDGSEDGAPGNGRQHPGMRGLGTLSTESPGLLHIRMSARAREYLYGPDSTLSLKA